MNPIVEWPEDKYNWPPDFLAATKANEGKFTIGPRARSSTRPPASSRRSSSAIPFPTIDPSDPQAAASRSCGTSSTAPGTSATCTPSRRSTGSSPHALERRTDQDVRFMYYDGVPEDERACRTRRTSSASSSSSRRRPADLNGTAALTWRYRDPSKRDSTWAYVPALRRVRAVSPANRSDGFLGSDMSQDDGPFFDGKPEDFDLEAEGRGRPAPPRRSAQPEGQGRSRWVPTGGWDANWPDIHVHRLHGPGRGRASPGRRAAPRCSPSAASGSSRACRRTGTTSSASSSSTSTRSPTRARGTASSTGRASC